MYLIQVALFVLYYFNYCYCASTRVWLNRRQCSKQGFTCVPGNKTLIYECPVKTKEYHIYVNEFNGPTYLESLIIRNCKTLTVLLRCTKYRHERKTLKYLEVSNIERLKIQSTKSYHSQLPPKVVFEDIKLIEKIPSYSFTQTNKRLNRARCIVPDQDFNSVYLRNVTINALDAYAFYMPNKFGNVTFTDVRLNNMDTSSVIVNHDESGVFSLEKGVVQALKPFSFQIVGKRATFSESTFIDIPSSGINATTETFNFINNSVKTLRSHALSILAANVFILNNRFDSLKAGAFEQIGPRAFRELKFTYHFSQNDINFMDAGCLHPNLIAYENVSSEISFSSNRLSCACDKLDWLFSTLDQGNITASKAAFYKMVFDVKYENTCSNSCNLPLMATRRMIQNGNCMQNRTLQWLCENKDTDTTITTLPPPTSFSITTASVFRSPTTPPAKINFTATSVSENMVNFFIKTSESGIDINNKSETVPIIRIKFSMSNSNPTTALVKLPILRTTKYRKAVEEPTYSTVKSQQTDTSVLANLATSSSSIKSSSSPNKVEAAAVTSSMLSPVTNELGIPESLTFENSAKVYCSSVLLLTYTILFVIII